MKNFWTQLSKEWREQIRTSRVLVVAIVFTFFALSSPLLARYMPDIFAMIPEMEDIALVVPEPTFPDAVAQYVKNIQQFAVMLAIFLAMGAVATEKERSTAVLVLTKPVGRGAFIAAKFAALALNFAVGIVLAGAAGYYYTMLLFEAPAIGPWLTLNALIWLNALVFSAITLLASTLFRQQAVAAAAGFGALLLLGGLGALPKTGELLPNQLVNWGIEVFSNPTARYWPALGISLGLIMICLAAAWAVLSRQDL